MWRWGGCRPPTGGAKLRYVLSRPGNAANAVWSALGRRRKTLSLTQTLAGALDVDPAALTAQNHFVEHHVAHIASAYYCSPFDNAAGFSIDGSGDFVSGMAARCDGTRIDVLDRVPLPASLGHFYTAMCQFIGFDLFGEEYKVMGLAPYGEDRFAREMAAIVKLEGTPWYGIEPRYLDVWNGLAASEVNADGQLRLGTIYAERMADLFGPPRRRDDPLTRREMDIARSTQAMFERGGWPVPHQPGAARADGSAGDGRWLRAEWGNERQGPARNIRSSRATSMPPRPTMGPRSVPPCTAGTTGSAGMNASSWSMPSGARRIPTLRSAPRWPPGA